MSRLHEHLLQIVIQKPEDYDCLPEGRLIRWEKKDEAYGDCSCGCKWYLTLEGRLGMDWGVCANPASHRAGLLTFEHQGCQKFELPKPSNDDWE
jgi:hypothetical protein